MRIHRAFLAIVLLPLVPSSFAAEQKPSTPDAMRPTAWDATPQQFAEAILRETNRVRRQNFRWGLKADSKLNLAADDQASYNALQLKSGHISALPGQGNPIERARSRGASPTLVTENVAMFSVREADPPPTVDDVAKQLVEMWMDSPRHRDNLLNRNVTHLGASVRVGREPQLFLIFGVQVFARGD